MRQAVISSAAEMVEFCQRTLEQPVSTSTDVQKKEQPVSTGTDVQKKEQPVSTGTDVQKKSSQFQQGQTCRKRAASFNKDRRNPCPQEKVHGLLN